MTTVTMPMHCIDWHPGIPRKRHRLASSVHSPECVHCLHNLASTCFMHNTNTERMFMSNDIKLRNITLYMF